MSDPVDALVSRLEAALPLTRVGDSLEREVKVLDVDPDALVATLQRLGAHEVFRGRVASAILTLPGVVGDGVLKYRTLGDAPPVLILKGPRLPHPRFKLQREVTWQLPAGSQLADVAAAIGASVEDQREKHRVSHTVACGGGVVRVDLDTRAGIPPLAEFEASDDAAIDAAIAAVGLGGKEHSSETESELLGRKRAPDDRSART